MRAPDPVRHDTLLGPGAKADADAVVFGFSSVCLQWGTGVIHICQIESKRLAAVVGP